MKIKQISEDEPITTDPRMRAAITELEDVIRSHYPEVTFSVSHGTDDPDAVHIYATVDLEDTEPVVDLVLERELELLTEGLPIHVIPLRTPERNEAILRAQQEARRNFS
jgi:hypothetical protein